MNEQQDKQKAIEALSAAGFKQGDVLWYRGRGDSIDMCNLQDDGLFELQLVGKHKDLAALLNHITKAQVERAVRKAAAERMDELAIPYLVQDVMERLFPEEAPTDANPG